MSDLLQTIKEEIAKPSYTLQDAKDEVAKEQLYDDWTDFYTVMIGAKNYSELRLYCDKAAELYKEKATEDLRKENEERKEIISDFHKHRRLLWDEIEHLKDLNNEVEQKLEESKYIANQEIERLTQSNKELVEALETVRLLPEKPAQKELHVDLWKEGEEFYNKSYSGTEMSEFLKPYVINSYIAGKKSVTIKRKES